MSKQASFLASPPKSASLMDEGIGSIRKNRTAGLENAIVQRSQVGPEQTTCVSCRRARVASAILIVGMTLSCAAPSPANSPGAIPRAPGHEGGTVVVGVTIVDVRSGRLLPDRSILLRGNSIVAVTAGRQPPGASRRIDGRGLYAIPGLWDMHVHALWADSIPEAFLPRFVAAGVTGVRDMGGTADVLVATRGRLQRGELVSPRIVAAGLILDGPEPADPSISIPSADSAEAVTAVDSLASLGADFVKVYTLLPPEAFFAAATRARELGLPVVGHVPFAVPPPEAARAGMRSIEHLREELDLLCTPADSRSCNVVLKALSEHQVWQTPTLSVLEAKAGMRELAFADSAAAWPLPEAVRDLWHASRASRMDRDERYWSMRAKRWEDGLWLTRLMHDRGIPLLAGSDTPLLFAVPGESLHHELELLVEAGLRPIDALRAATVEAAIYLGVPDRFGAVEQGMAGDLVLLDADPLRDISATRRIVGVFLGGRYFDRAALDALAGGTTNIESTTGALGG